MHQLRHIVIATKYIAIKMGVYQKDNTFDNKNSYAARRGFISVCYLASHEVYREIIVMRGYQDALSKFATRLASDSTFVLCRGDAAELPIAALGTVFYSL